MKIRFFAGGFLLALAVILLNSPVHARRVTSISQQCLDLMLGKQVAVDPSAPTIRFSHPTDRAVFYGDSLSVTVQVENAPPNLGGWNLWVNGTPYVTAGESAAVKTGPGIFALCAVLYDANNADIGNADFITVTVVQPGAGTPTSAPGAALSSIALSPPEEENSPLTIILLAVGAFVAALAGWWMGKRLPKRRSRRS